MDELTCIECGCDISFDEFMELDGMCQTCYDEDCEDKYENIARWWGYSVTGDICYLGTALTWLYERGEAECRMAA